MPFFNDDNFQAAQDRINQLIKKQARALKKSKEKTETYRRQLEYLCYKSELFNQQRDWNSLFSVLFETFRELFPKKRDRLKDRFHQEMVF